MLSYAVYESVRSSHRPEYQGQFKGGGRYQIEVPITMLDAEGSTSNTHRTHGQAERQQRSGVC